MPKALGTVFQHIFTPFGTKKQYFKNVSQREVCVKFFFMVKYCSMLFAAEIQILVRKFVKQEKYL